MIDQEEKDFRIGQVLSRAAPSSHLTTKHAINLLERHAWNVNDALGEMADIQESEYILYRPDEGTPLQGCDNAGNTCYLDAVLVAMLARLDAYDGLLSPMYVADDDERAATGQPSHQKHRNSIPRSTSPPPSPTASSSKKSSSPKLAAKKQPHHGHSHAHHNADSSPHTTRQRMLSPDRDPEKVFAQRSEEQLLGHGVVELRRKLRLFANQLRSGKRVSKNTMEEIRAELAHCGWAGGCTGAGSEPSSPTESRSGSPKLPVMFSFLKSSSSDKHTPTYNYNRSQMDASEFFIFLSDILRSPFLVLQETLFHGGKQAPEDQKITTQRVLELSLPQSDDLTASSSASTSAPAAPASSSSSSSPPSDTLYLDRILMDHFYNNPVSGFKRFVEVATAPPDRLSRTLSRSMSTAASGADNGLPAAPPRVQSISYRPVKRTTLSDLPPAFTAASSSSSATPIDVKRSSKRDSKGTQSSQPPQESVPKLVTMEVSGWKAMSLLPFLTSQNETGEDTRAASWQFKRYMIPMVLKRYSFESGVGRRIHRKVVIPFEMNITDFVNVQTGGGDSSGSNGDDTVDMQRSSPRKMTQRTTLTRKFPYTSGSTDDKSSSPPSRRSMDNPPSYEEAEASLASGYILRLRSVVCHLGATLDSGHYISYVCGNVGPHDSSSTPFTTNNISSSSSSGTSNPSSTASSTATPWYRIDDMDTPHVRECGDALRNIASPFYQEIVSNAYILFYELLKLSPEDYLRVKSASAGAAEGDEALARRLQLREMDAMDEAQASTRGQRHSGSGQLSTGSSTSTSNSAASRVSPRSPASSRKKGRKHNEECSIQ